MPYVLLALDSLAVASMTTALIFACLKKRDTLILLALASFYVFAIPAFILAVNMVA